jgi:hypothetical protein
MDTTEQAEWDAILAQRAQEGEQVNAEFREQAGLNDSQPNRAEHYRLVEREEGK